jgi:hypothetical protein
VGLGTGSDVDAGPCGSAEAEPCAPMIGTNSYVDAPTDGSMAPGFSVSAGSSCTPKLDKF